MYAKQIFFDEENIKKLYLSPYCEINRMEDGFHIKRVDKDVFLIFSDEFMSELIEKLKKGIYLEELKEYLDKNGCKDSDEWIGLCIFNGVIA